MDKHLKRLWLILADWTGPDVPSVERVDIDALTWAIDQLRWRRVEDELPTEDGTYQILIGLFSGSLIPEHATWQHNSWRVPYSLRPVKWWRPVEMPEHDR